MANLSKRIELDEMKNTRDIGGMVTQEGRIIKRGVFYRSGHIARATYDDIIWVKNHVDTIIDFRSDKEVFEAPDRVIEGVSYVRCPAINATVDGITREKNIIRTVVERYAHHTEQTALSHMENVYHDFVERDFVSDCYSRYVDMLADRNTGRILVHCAAGKDRAGFATIILQEILGVSREDIIADYMLSNEYVSEEVDYMMSQIPEEAKDRYLPVLNRFYLAYPEYIESMYDNIDSKYPTFAAFAADRLGLTDEKADIIRKRYLE